MQVRRTPQVFFSCVYWRCLQVKFKLFLALPFAVKLVDNRKVWCASKADTVDNPQPQSLRVLYDTLLFCFGEQRINKQRLVRKLVKNSQMNEKICQWSYRFWMYKVKWWLKRQWKLIHRLNIDYRTLKLKILQAIWLWWQSECSRLYSLIGPYWVSQIWENWYGPCLPFLSAYKFVLLVSVMLLSEIIVFNIAVYEIE